MTATRITVDNITYCVLVEYDTLKRSFELMEGDNAGTAISGRTIRDILGTNYTYNMTVRADPAYPSDYDSFYWTISSPIDSHQIEIPCGYNRGYGTDIWQRGAIASASGANSSNTSTTRIRTTTYLDSSIKIVTPKDGYGFYIAAYDASEVYQGMWTGSTLQNSATMLKKEIILSDIGNYKFRLVARRVDDGAMSVANSEMILLDTGKISFEAKILSGSDTYKGYYMNHKYWDELEVTFEPMEPQRK